MEIKTIEYVRNRIDLGTNKKENEKNSFTTLGNLQVRYSGENSGIGNIEFKTLAYTQVTYQYTKHGAGGNYLGRYGQIASDGHWYDFGHGGNVNATSGSSKGINLNNRDVASATFILHNTREVYRLTVNANNYISKYGSVPAAPASVSIFIERLE